MKSCLVFLFLAATAAHAQQSINNGQVEQVTGYNNRAMQFGSDAEAWKKEFPLEEVRKPASGNGSSTRLRFCLEGMRRGAKLLNSGNDVSVDYEAYMANPGNVNPGLTSAYQNQERNLHGLKDEIEKRKAAAKCN